MARAMRPRRPLKSPRRPRRAASSIDNPATTGAASPVGQPNANTGMVTYPLRPNGCTALLAFVSSATARSSGYRLRLIVGRIEKRLKLTAEDLASASTRQFVEYGDLAWHLVVRQVLPDVCLEGLWRRGDPGVEHD